MNGGAMKRIWSLTRLTLGSIDRPGMGGMIVALVATLLLCGCVTRTKPVADRVCIQAKRLPAHEEAYFSKKAIQYLNEYGFVAASENCEVTVQDERFGDYQGERWVAKAGYWSQEGIANLSFGGVVVYEDFQVSLRGYPTNQDLLDGLAWALVKPVTKLYRPTPKAK